MMERKEREDAAKDKRIDEVVDKFAFELDDICHEIFFTLIAYKSLRFNQLHGYLRKFGTEVSKPSLSEHLKHLIKQKLIKRKASVRNVSYCLTDEISSLFGENTEGIKEWLNEVETNGKLNGRLKVLKLDEKQYYENMPEKQLDCEIVQDLESTFLLNLHELRNMIEYDLKIDKDESDAAFWKFLGDPLCRMHERFIAEKCRASDRYKEKLFTKIQQSIHNRSFRTRTRTAN